MHSRSLVRYVYLSILAAILTIGLKYAAYWLTGSVGLLSDAIESLVNLAAAIMALLMLRLSEKPPDEDHAYGHSKAEYFSSIVEGVLIVIAAITIAQTSITRLFSPQPIDQAFAGLAVSTIASLINLAVALILRRAGKLHRSITLEADSHHLMTDVWTSVGVIVGVALVSVTHIDVLDPLIGLLIAVNIIYTGVKIMKDSTLGLMDTSLPAEDMDLIKQILKAYETKGARYHGLRSRQSATRRFVSVHILVPGGWSVSQGHDLLEEIEIAICKRLPKTTVFTHLEPIEDPRSHTDTELDRTEYTTK